MISHISGKIKKRKDLSIVVDLDGLSYEVLIPPVVMKSIDSACSADGHINLITFHYYQMDQSKAVPVLIGFLNEIEKEFFEQFITVSGIGPKAACRALSLSFSTIAEAIDKGDAALLKTLPGIGEQKAREIIAKLQGKVGKYGLIRDTVLLADPGVKEDARDEALNVLMQLGYKKSEAKEMIEKASVRNSRMATCEDVLNEVYRARKDVK